MASLPSGVVTFLLTDVAGSTRLWEEHPQAMREALARHDEILRAAVEVHRGQVVKGTGDGILAVFAAAADAVVASVAAQELLAVEPWGVTGPIAVRMGLHTGACEERGGDYYGRVLNRAARLMAAAHGGQVAASLATEELARDLVPAEVEFLDLGEHRLRDLSRPEHVYQVMYPGSDRDFPPLRSLATYRGNLPIQLTSFVGRREELAAIGSALKEARLVTLTGVGGVGKTRLAAQVAAEVLPRFPDGAWLCELAVASDDDAMAQLIATTLGVSPRPGVSLGDAIIEFLAGKRILLVLDNCEHLLGAVASMTEAIVRGCPQVHVLATSRELLSVVGEHVIGLRSLPLPPEDMAPDAAAKSDAVRLFVQRARAVRSGFALDAKNSVPVSEICRRLDGIPLAIELAAAQMTAMSPREMAGLLDERFRLLTGGHRTAVERHQTLRATVDWSYSLLSEHEQHTFDRLGAFTGNFDIGAVTGVVADADLDEWRARDAVRNLVGKSTLVAEETADGMMRYSMLETLRAYARERLHDSGEADRWRRRHAEHYAELAEAVGPDLLCEHELDAIRRVSTELDNTRAAYTWAIGSSDPSDTELALRIVAALGQLSYAYNWVFGVGEWANRALDQAGLSRTGRRFSVIGIAAMHALHRGEIARAQSLAELALRDGVPTDSSVKSIAHCALAAGYALTNDYPRAVETMAEGHRALDAMDEASAYDHLLLYVCAAVSANTTQDLTAARAAAESALAVARELRHPTATLEGLHNFAHSVWRDDPDAPRRALDEAIALARTNAIWSHFPLVLGLAAQLRVVDDPVGALALLREGVQWGHDAGGRLVLATALDRGIHILESCDQPLPAAMITGAVTQGALAGMSMISIAEQDDRAAALEQLKARLGAAELDAALTRGAAMSYDEVVEYTLTELETITTELHDC